MTGEAIFVRLKNIKPIEGADNIVQANVFGETVIVTKDYIERTPGVLFDCETQLSDEFCSNNNLYRDSKKNVNTEQTGYFEDNRRVRPIKLKGVKCSGFFAPLWYLDYAHKDPYSIFEEGKQFTSIAGSEICKKYEVPVKYSMGKQSKISYNITPTFREHFDTDHLMRHLSDIKPHDSIIITEKLHGTSGRASNTLIRKKRWYDNILRKFGITVGNEYKFAVGSRRVVKSIGGNEAQGKNHYYNHDLWTDVSTKAFSDKLHKGETVYFEIVGYTPDGGLIMPEVSNTKLKKFLDKEEYKQFISKYGETTRFHYGTDRMSDENLYKVFVYRITMSNEDGHTIDYSWEQVKRRCDQLNVAYVPELNSGTMESIAHQYCVDNIDCDGREDISDRVEHLFTEYIEELAAESSLNFPKHIREGVCVRVETGSLTPMIFKHKSFIFKVLEGIIKDEGQIDLETQQSNS